MRRDTFPAEAIHHEVVERGRRALVVYGPVHFPRKEVDTNHDMSNWQAQTMTSLLEAAGDNDRFASYAAAPLDYAARRSPWSWLSQLTVWFQLVKIWVTT